MAFVAQRVGMESIGPFLFMGIRMLLGALVLLVVLLISAPTLRGILRSRRLLLGGLLCGGAIFLAGSAQQVGLVFTIASKAGFLTALYIVLVPILGMALGHKSHWNTWLAVLIAAIGLYLLCMTEGISSIRFGDAIVLLGAFFWACHILVVDHFVAGLSRQEVMALCLVQFAVAALLSLICAPFVDGFFVVGGFEPAALVEALPAVLYTGVLSTGLAFTLQAMGQQGLKPAAASIIMSLEAAFSVLGGTLLLGETLTGREALGCLVAFAAVIISQLPLGKGSTRSEKALSATLDASSPTRRRDGSTD
jgi:drug/metabolite transporter (DMT)-like permease